MRNGHQSDQQQSAVAALENATKTLLRGIENARTRRAYKARLSAFHAWLKTRKPNTIDARTVEKYLGYLASQGKETSTINQSLAAIRKLAAVNADYAIFRTIKTRKTAPSNGADTSQGRVLTKAQGGKLINAKAETLRGLRGRALVAVLLGCGLKLREITSLEFEQIARQGRTWMIELSDGRAIPLPAWAKRAIDVYARRAGIKQSKVFRRLEGTEGVSDDGLSEQIVYRTVTSYGNDLRIKVSPDDLRRTFANLAYDSGATLEQIQTLMGHDSIQNTQRLITRSSKRKAVRIKI